MISPKLQATFNIIETIMFPKWQKANEIDREKIVKKLGRLEAFLIMKEINAKMRLTSGNKTYLIK